MTEVAENSTNPGERPVCKNNKFFMFEARKMQYFHLRVPFSHSSFIINFSDK